MSFPEAISDGFRKYVVFSGRSSRSAYWWWTLFALLTEIVAVIIDTIAKTGSVFTIIALVGLFVPGLAVTVRRFHDAGHSGWWIWIALIPLLGAIVTLVFTLLGSDGPNKWGAGPDNLSVAPPTQVAL